MIRIQNLQALLIKQIKDTLKNPPVLVFFLVYPIIAFVMSSAMKGQEGAGAFISIFATMHCVFSPAVVASSILSEEKEGNTLRVLIMSNVTLREYFISIGGFVLIATVASGSIFLFITEKDFVGSIIFILSLGLGSFISIILGLCISLYAKNASAANGIAVPCGMIFAFLPMLANFNKSIENVSRFTFGQQVSYLLGKGSISIFGIIVISVNTILLAILASVLFRKSLAEE